jgi:hypothetical protein
MPYVGQKPADIIATAVDTTTGKFSGVVDADAGITVDNITIDGTEIDLSSGDLTLDVAGDIILDADGTQVILKDGGTEFGHLYNTNSDFGIKSTISDKDIKFVGNDGGSIITALQLDMSDAGRAIFNAGLSIGGTGSANTLDDYEEGTFTPTWNGYTPYGTSGKYVKIGTQVTVYATLVTNSGTDESLIQIDNLPFQVAGNQGGGMVDHNGLGLYAYNINTKFTNNSTICKLFVSSGGAEVGIKYVSGSQPTLGGFSSLIWTLVYQTT